MDKVVANVRVRPLNSKEKEKNLQKVVKCGQENKVSGKLLVLGKLCTVKMRDCVSRATCWAPPG